MTDLIHKLKLEAEINTLKKRILNTNSRLDIAKVNCLLSKYFRLYGNKNRELKNSRPGSLEPIKQFINLLKLPRTRFELVTRGSSIHCSTN